MTLGECIASKREFSDARSVEGFSRAIPMHTTLPRRFYTDPDFYRAELARFYFERWICAGRADQIPRAGDYFTRTLGDESLIVTRDGSGAVHALFNVCRHRGTRLCEQPEGHFVDRIQCPYHNWTYDLEGRLLAAPHMPPGFCKDEYPLHRAGCEVWDGHVFVHLGRAMPDRTCHCPPPPARPALPALSDQLADLPARFAPWQMADLRLGRRIVYDVKANWKLIVLELQRVPALPEPASRAEQAASLPRRRQRRADGVLLRRGDGVQGRRRDDEHGRQAAARVSAGAERGAAPAGHLLHDLPEPAAQPPPGLRDDAHAVAARATTGREIVCEWHFHPDELARPDFQGDDAVEFWDLTNREDWWIAEQSQAGINSLVYQPGPYSEREELLWSFDEIVTRAKRARHRTANHLAIRLIGYVESTLPPSTGTAACRLPSTNRSARTRRAPPSARRSRRG